MVHLYSLIIFFLPAILLTKIPALENIVIISIFIAPLTAGFMELRHIFGLKKDKLKNVLLYILVFFLSLVVYTPDAFSADTESAAIVMLICAIYLFAQVLVLVVLVLYSLITKFISRRKRS